MSKEIKDASSWLEILADAMDDLSNFIPKHDVFTSYDLGVLYDLQTRLLKRFDEKKALLAELMKEETADV